MTIFLDFDGVTHAQGCNIDTLFCRMPLIADVLREFPSVEIVISSSWRSHFSLEDMREFFAADIQPRVIGVTPIPDAAAEYERQWECERWMQENREAGEPWMAIDDQSTWFAPNCPKLLSTDPAFGFSQDDRETLGNMLAVITDRGVGGAYFAYRREYVGGVGMDDEGNIVHAAPTKAPLAVLGNTMHTTEDLWREIEIAIQTDDGRAAKSQLAAGRAIYYGDPQYPDQIVKEFPDGRRQLVTIDDQNVVTVVKEI